ncbi:ATP-binding protein [Sporomusa sphaeroides DSM 2875]|uniref:ATP-binding protein n=1 Tax=Sporomusa sphaeroides TaxID=47679 RepID=UPI002030874F|nr:ATP-binding protein [Sporomusa sphaeroides]MCM0758074.1 ATP-binding protein [Sporomusa sphaeroides DSM 2875]
MSTVFKKAERRKAKLRLALCGPSGSGKTYSALKIAKGMGGRIALVDTENGSGLLYCDIADYDAAEIAPPFTVEKYIGAIKEAEAAGYDTLIIDSLTHAWAGQGGLLEEVDKRKSGANSFGAWRHVTPMHNTLVDTILQSKMHVIVTMRSKTAYEIEKDEKGKAVPVKKGMAPIQRDGLEYEFTVVLDMDNERHIAQSGKDRTGMFDGKYFVPDENTGAQLMQWLNMGVEAQPQYYQGYQQQQYGYPGYGQPQYAQPMQQYQTPVQEQPFSPPPEPVPQQPQGFGFLAYEQEITYWWQAAGWSLDGVNTWVSQGYQGRTPAQLTVEECQAIAAMFKNYYDQKQGGQS